MNSETVNLSIPFDFLLQAVARLDSAEKERLWEFLDEDLHGDDEDATSDPQEEAEVAQAYQEYKNGDYLTLNEYVAQRPDRLS
ncbi:MAG: hypothetical protein F6K00_22825 [Leptolyngbya sp. SIOISBB]|nr:hypothetical protein [Leptolyngbya sp. SIOISBB]